MAYALVANTKSSLPATTDSATTAAIDTTGANLIVIGVSFYSGSTSDVTISDSKSNTWTAILTQQSLENSKVKLLYCFSPTVGSGHTFTSAGSATYSSIFVQAFSGSVSSPLDQSTSAAGGGGVSAQPGSVTPTENNEVLVTVEGGIAVGTTGYSINSSFTITDQNARTGSENQLPGGLAYKIQTTAGAENPTWSWTGAGTGDNSSAIIATFKDTPGGGGASHVLAMMAQNEG